MKSFFDSSDTLELDALQSTSEYEPLVLSTLVLSTVSPNEHRDWLVSVFVILSKFMGDRNDSRGSHKINNPILFCCCF